MQRTCCRYYKPANKKVEDAILEVLEDERKARLAANRLRRRLGADQYYVTRGIGTVQLAAFSFASLPDPKVWKWARSMPARCNLVFRPRSSTKAGREILAAMREIKFGSGERIAKILKLSIFGNDGTWRTPGVTLTPTGRVLLTVKSSKEPKGCKRISDLAFERACKRKKKKK